MPVSQDLADFTRRALEQGRSRAEISSSLQTAEWTEREIDAALNAWNDAGDMGPVPRPIRTTAAKDALFYALLFVAFGMVAGNVLILAFTQIAIYFPDATEYRSVRAISSARWSMAALIVFLPLFLTLDFFDGKAVKSDPARKHGAIRRWLSAFALFVAVVTLLGDALFLIYSLLNGDLTTRFLAKSAVVAVMAGLVLGYFRKQDNPLTFLGINLPAWILAANAIAVLALSFMSFGGPAQGSAERRDKARIRDMQTLSRDIQRCDNIDRYQLPDTLDPLACANRPDLLTGFAGKITYHRLGSRDFELCTTLEAPGLVQNSNISLDGNLACLKSQTR